VAGGKASLMTFPVIEAEDMPNVAANSLSIAFGDFGRGYLVVDRAGVRVLRDPFSAKPYVLFSAASQGGGLLRDVTARPAGCAVFIRALAKPTRMNRDNEQIAPRRSAQSVDGSP
jgi:hypothetical protein